jgi:hypothetical protein
MTLSIDLRSLAHALGGDVSSGQVLAPGPGHSAADRSMSVRPDSSAPDGFVVHSFSTDDPIICKDYVRKKLGLAPFNQTAAIAQWRLLLRLHQNAGSSQNITTPMPRVSCSIRCCDTSRSIFYSEHPMFSASGSGSLMIAALPIACPS